MALKKGLLRENPGRYRGYGGLDRLYRQIMRNHFEAWDCEKDPEEKVRYEPMFAGHYYSKTRCGWSDNVEMALLEAKEIIDTVEPHEITEGYLHRWMLHVPDVKYGYGIFFLHYMFGDDTALPHNHSWPHCSLILDGTHVEDFIHNGKMTRTYIYPKMWVCRDHDHTHLLSASKAPAISLVFTGVRQKSWQFVDGDKRYDGNAYLREHGVKKNPSSHEEW